jgi:enoyl-CoA hydratase
MTQDSEILFEVQGGIGLVTLNRPAALNALTLGMIRALDKRLIAFAKEPTIKAVIITGAGDRAFCSGGDVKAVALESKAMQEGAADSALARDFFREEYILNHRIFTFPKPYISLVNGIVMGGGKGVSAHGSHRVVTETTLFAMPETNIGFFPDVGGGYFLPRCPGQTGAYLALTSKRIKAIDTVYIGFGTHYVTPDAMQDLKQELFTMHWEQDEDAKSQVDRVIEKHTSEPAGVSELAPHREQIDTCFGHDRVEDIIAALQADGSDWANETLQAMYAMSPTSLKIALRQIRMGANMPFAQVMTMEYRLSQALMKKHDFYEGIRAALIDKDRQPKWQPPRIAEVSDQDIDACFQSLGERDLVL